MRGNGSHMVAGDGDVTQAGEPFDSRAEGVCGTGLAPRP
jgi:hypothetical protein